MSPPPAAAQSRPPGGWLQRVLQRSLSPAAAQLLTSALESWDAEDACAEPVGEAPQRRERFYRWFYSLLGGEREGLQLLLRKRDEFAQDALRGLIRELL